MTSLPISFVAWKRTVTAVVLVQLADPETAAAADGHGGTVRRSCPRGRTLTPPGPRGGPPVVLRAIEHQPSAGIRAGCQHSSRFRFGRTCSAAPLFPRGVPAGPAWLLLASTTVDRDLARC